MTSLILTHNIYTITSLVTLILGSFFISNHLHERWFSKFEFQLVDTNLVVKLLIVVFGSFIVPWSSLLNITYGMFLLSIFSGIIIGYIYLVIETNLISLFSKHSKAVSLTKNLKPFHTIFRKNSDQINKLPPPPSYISTITVGALEEILYRGFLTILCLTLLSHTVGLLSLLFVTLVFALNHLNFGVVHVIGKTILGAFCLLAFIVTQNIITPIVIHITFNALVIHNYRKLEYAL